MSKILRWCNASLSCSAKWPVGRIFILYQSKNIPRQLTSLSRRGASASGVLKTVKKVWWSRVGRSWPRKGMIIILLCRDWLLRTRRVYDTKDYSPTFSHLATTIRNGNALSFFPISLATSSSLTPSFKMHHDGKSIKNGLWDAATLGTPKI